MMKTRTASQVKRLRAAELEAERHYGEVVKDSDLAEVRNAAEKWRKAADELSRYVAQHPHPYRDIRWQALAHDAE
jgi:hypothetical protein